MNKILYNKRSSVNNNNIMVIIFTFLILFVFTISLINNVQAKTNKEHDKIYVSIEIKQGDTLSSYAEKYAAASSDYDEYIEEIRYINNLKNDTLYAGCYLLIPIYN